MNYTHSKRLHSKDRLRAVEQRSKTLVPSFGGFRVFTKDRKLGRSGMRSRSDAAHTLWKRSPTHHAGRTVPKPNKAFTLGGLTNSKMGPPFDRLLLSRSCEINGELYFFCKTAHATPLDRPRRSKRLHSKRLHSKRLHLKRLHRIENGSPF